MRTLAAISLGVVIGILAMGFGQSGWVVPPVFDPGHRLYGATSERAARTVLDVILYTTDHNVKASLAVGPTRQYVLDDGQRTVIAWFDGPVLGPHNALSFWSSNPTNDAKIAASVLRTRGFTAEISTYEYDGQPIVAVKTDALYDGGLVFRPHWLQLGKPKAISLPER